MTPESRLDFLRMVTKRILQDGATLALLYPKRKNGFKQGRWFSVSQDALNVLKQFTRVDDFRVLMALLERLDYQNYISVSQADIAKELSMDPSQVNRSIKRLIGSGAINEGPKVGVTRTYLLNPNFGWKGSAQNHVISLADERVKRSESTQRCQNTKDLFE